MYSIYTLSAFIWCGDCFWLKCPSDRISWTDKASTTTLSFICLRQWHVCKIHNTRSLPSICKLWDVLTETSHSTFSGFGFMGHTIPESCKQLFSASEDGCNFNCSNCLLHILLEWVQFEMGFQACAGIVVLIQQQEPRKKGGNFSCPSALLLQKIPYKSHIYQIKVIANMHVIHLPDS